MRRSTLTAQELLALPLFSELSVAELGGAETQLRTEQCAYGTNLFRRGDPGDSLYVVLDGQVTLELFQEGEPRVVAVCGPGDWFGELALLTGAPRSADARITVDARLLRVTRSAWDMLSRRAPRLFAKLCERLSRQLRASTDPPSRPRRTVVACEDAEAWLPALLQSLARQFPGRDVHALAADGSPLGVPRRDTQQPARPGLEHALARIVSHDALILAAVSASPASDLRLRRLDARGWRLAPGRRGDHDEIRAPSEGAALDRVVRYLAGGTVGLALGAGGAYGLSHLGLLATLERAGIPVDFVAGSSIGAIVGAARAAGTPVPRMIEFAESVARRYRRILLRDLAPWGQSLLRGNAIMEVLAEIEELRHATWEQLELPFAAIAMDLRTGEEVVIDRGPVLEGIRPSFAMPGIFSACELGGRRMVDGAMVNPVPVDRVRALGADVVVAAQPIPALSPEGDDPVGAAVGRARRLADLGRVRQLRNRLETLGASLRSFQALWFRLASAGAATADVVVAPDLPHFWFLQFGAARPIVEAGTRCAEAALPAIRSVLEERVGLASGSGARRPDAS